MAFDPRQYAIEARKKGVSTNEIYATLKANGVFDALSSRRSFVQELLPTAGMIVGGKFGVPGAAIGGALGEAAQQSIERVAGQRKAFDPGQIAQAGITGGTLQIGAEALPLAAKGIISPLRQPIVRTLSKLSGYAKPIVEKALARTPGVVAAVKEGEEVLSNIIRSSAKKFSAFANKSLTKHKTAVEGLVERSIPKNAPAILKDMVEKIDNVLTEQHNIPIQNGALQFAGEQTQEAAIRQGNRLFFPKVDRPSRIVPVAERGSITEAYNLTRALIKNPSIQNIDSVHERLLVLSSKTPAGTPTGSETKAVINSIIKEVENMAGNLYDDYGKLLSQNKENRIFITQGREIFGDTANPSPKEVDKIKTFLLRIYNTGKGETLGFAERTGAKFGEDITGAVAGTKIQAGIGANLQGVTTIGGILQKIVGDIPNVVIRNYAARGTLSQGLENHPLLRALSKATGITIKSLAAETANLLEAKQKR